VSASTTPPERPDASGWTAGRGDRVVALSQYFLAHADRFTADALRQAATEADFTPEEIVRATELMVARQRADEQVLPLRRQARWVVIGAYLIVWLLFGAVFLTKRMTYDAGVILQGILTVALLIALGLSLLWVRGRHPEPSTVGRALVVFLVVPFILLIGIAGLCLPFTRSV
jgi:hypothetical protein